MSERKRQWHDKLFAATALIKKNSSENPENASIAISIFLHAVLFLFCSFYHFNYHGTISGNNEINAEGENIIKVDFIAGERPKAAAIDKAFAKLAATKKINPVSEAKKSRKKNVKVPAKPAPKKLPAGKNSLAASKNVKKETLFIDDNSISDNKNAKKIIKAIEIPPELSKKLDEKLKTAELNHNKETSSETLVKKIIDENEPLENLSLSKSEIKTLDISGELIASSSFTHAIKPETDIDIDDELFVSGTDEKSSELNVKNKKNGDAKKKTKAGSGAYGKPSGGRQSMIFEMVENSSYDEIPSFLNGAPAIDYPKWAQEQGVEGTVKILLEILPDGEVGMVSKFESPISDRLAQYLIKQSEMWRFKPIYKNGRPLSGTVMVTVDFSLTASKTTVENIL